MVICSKCKHPLTHPESIIRGMGPICYGKNYTYKRLRKEKVEDRHLTEKELEEKYGKSQILEWANQEVIKYRKQIKKNKRLVLRMRRIKANQKRPKNQQTLDYYLNKKGYLIDINFIWRPFTLLKKHRSIRECELEKLYEERSKLAQSLSKSTGFNGVLDQFESICNKIKNLEEQNNDN